MNYFQRGSIVTTAEAQKRLSAWYMLLTLGILSAISGGTWDVTNHLLNKPETFFSPPHGILYSGAGIAVFGAMLVLHTSRKAGKTGLPAMLAISGVILLMGAGPVDFWWHSLYGLDGLLSPPHAVLISGMLTSSIGAMIGTNSTWPRTENKRKLPKTLAIIGLLPVWLAAAGIIHMFSLPFSHTGFFNFDPQPQAGAILATLGFPLITAAAMAAAFGLGGGRFGVASTLAGAFVLISTLTSIIPNESLWPTIPFYLSVLVPLVAVDLLFSYWSNRSHNGNNTGSGDDNGSRGGSGEGRRESKGTIAIFFVAGAIAGISFFVLYYPLITHTYNQVMMPQRAVWPSLTALIYFEMIKAVLPQVVIPACAMGILGAILGSKMAERV